MGSPELLAVDEVAGYLRIHRVTVIQLIKAGELKAFKLHPKAKCWQIHHADLLAFVAARRAAGAKGKHAQVL